MFFVPLKNDFVTNTSYFCFSKDNNMSMRNYGDLDDLKMIVITINLSI